MIPGVTDTAENLDAALGDLECRFRGDGRSDGYGERGLIGGNVLAQCASRIPRRDAGLLGVTEHSCDGVLDALELADDTAELPAHPRIVRGGRGGPVREAGRLGCEERCGDVEYPAGVHGQHVIIGEGQPVRGDLGVAPHHVVTRQVRDADTVTSDHHECALAPVVGGEQEHVGHLATEHDSRCAGQADRGSVANDAQPARLQRHRTVQCTVRQSLEFRSTPRLVQNRGRDHRREERSGHHGSAQFLGDNSGFEITEAGAADVFRQMQSQHAEVGERTPERRPGLRLGIDSRADHLGRRVSCRPAAYGITKLAVLVTQSQSHERVP